MNNTICIVLGGYVNSFTIVRELYDFGVRNIALIDYGKSVAKRSNRITYHRSINKDSESLLESILEVKNMCDRIIIYPTDDSHLRFLHRIYQDIKTFAYLPFNNDNLIQSLDKFYQYDMCEKLGVPYPKTVNLVSILDVDKLDHFDYPILIKPNVKNDSITIFRTLVIYSAKELSGHKKSFEIYFLKDFTFIASELIPGDDTNIFAYTGFVSSSGAIANEWIGKKLTQYPDNFGVFSSASNEAPQEVLDQGRLLLEGMSLRGICEPEFKYDVRDKKYKLMEINLRSMMWHRMGYVDGVALHKSMYDDALGLPITHNKQSRENIKHLVYLKHELLNLFSRKGYWKHFKYNVFSKNSYYALFDRKDIKPFLYDLPSTFKGILTACLKK